MPIGYVTGNQGESRYTVAIPRSTPLLTALIEARRVEIEGIDKALEELRKHEAERRAVYDAAMADVHLATLMYTECRESYTEPQCRADKIAAANSAYSAARNACDDTWRDCRGACDIGDGDCSGACDDARDACELAAETTRDRALAAVDRLCVDEVVAHMAACQAEHAPIIASDQAAAVEALAPLQDVMIAITWEKTKRTSAVRRLNELEAIESSAESATCWSAQYNTEIPTGEVPEEPAGDEENAVIVATVSGRSVITEISSVNPCAHDSRALPADVLFVDAALAPGAETWRPTWRTGTVTAINEDGTLKVRIDPAILPGTLGTRVSRNPINCTPPGAFFDESGELDARLGIARQEYDDALEDLADVRAEIQTCKDGYSVQECTEPRNETCEYNREQSMMACIDNRDYCLSIATDNNGIQYCLDQFALCEQQVDAIFSACVDGATADCIEAKRQHDAQCEQTSQFALSQAETAVSTAQRNLLNASADIQGPPAELIRDLPVAHCSASIYEVGDDVLIDFPTRAPSTGLDWATATSAQIRAAAMAVWQSARVVGWASDTRECGYLVHIRVNGGQCYAVKRDLSIELIDGFNFSSSYYEGKINGARYVLSFKFYTGPFPDQYVHEFFCGMGKLRSYPSGLTWFPSLAMFAKSGELLVLLQIAMQGRDVVMYASRLSDIIEIPILFARVTIPENTTGLNVGAFVGGINASGTMLLASAHSTFPLNYGTGTTSTYYEITIPDVPNPIEDELELQIRTVGSGSDVIVSETIENSSLQSTEYAPVFYYIGDEIHRADQSNSSTHTESWSGGGGPCSSYGTSSQETSTAFVDGFSGSTQAEAVFSAARELLQFEAEGGVMWSVCIESTSFSSSLSSSFARGVGGHIVEVGPTHESGGSEGKVETYVGVPWEDGYVDTTKTSSGSSATSTQREYYLYGELIAKISDAPERTNFNWASGFLSAHTKVSAMYASRTTHWDKRWLFVNGAQIEDIGEVTNIVPASERPLFLHRLYDQ